MANFTLFDECTLTQEQIQQIGHSLLHLAHIDGLDERELALIQSFYQTQSNEEVLTATSTEYDLSQSMTVIKQGGDEVIKAFLISCFLLMYTDGHISSQEQAIINQFSVELNINSKTLDTFHYEAKLCLWTTLASQIRNRIALTALAKDLQLEESDLKFNSFS